MKKVMVVFGTRPEAIKLAPVVRALRQRRDVSVVTCSTGQHRDMLEQILPVFGIEPDIALDSMAEGQSLNQLSARVLSSFDQVLETERPDWVVVQGDTTTAVIAALAAFYRRVRVGHVEAGLRTFDRGQPYPEEVNRRLAAVLADLHFAPTRQAKANLIAEGVSAERVVVTGNTVIDALKWILSRSNTGAQLPKSEALRRLKEVRAQGSRVVLVTAHRRENFGEPLREICGAVRDLALWYSGSVHFVYPMHLNPNVRRTALRELHGMPNVILCEPLDYVSLLRVMQLSHLVLTDSGGIQEEAPALGIPVLVLRETTERPEGVQSGCARLIGTGQNRITLETRRLLDHPEAHREMSRAVHVYGDGLAAERVAHAISNFGESGWRRQCEWNSTAEEMPTDAELIYSA